MKKSILNLVTAALFLMTVLLSPQFSSAQYSGKKNTVKFNLTNPLIFGKKAIVLGYERTIGKHQSFTIETGMFSLPSFGLGKNSDSLQLESDVIDKGFHIAAGYRFYLAKENKYEAPRGLFVGPYISYNDFSRKNSWMLNTVDYNGEVKTELGMTLASIGVELGYQFVLWDRLALDFVMMGPSLTSYKFDVDVNNNLSPEDKELFFQRVNDYLSGKIPGYNLVVKEGEFLKNGSFKTTSFGFRYMINIGYRF